MLSTIRRMKTDLLGMSWLEGKIAPEIKVLLLTLVILGMITMKANAALNLAPNCKPETLCFSLDQAQLDWSTPQMKVSITTPVLAGPGISFSSYGELPEGFISKVIGISEDGNWWVIPLPSNIARDKKGWVDASMMIMQNVKPTPEWLKHCDLMTYCGYILSHSPQYVAIMYPSLTAD